MKVIKRCFLILAVISIFIILSDNHEVHASERAIKTVNTTIRDTMSQGGCWAEVSFKVSGTYAYNGSNLINTDIAVSIQSAPEDWTVAIDRVGYELSGTNLIVKISYHYKASYYDCGFTGGYVYTMVQGIV